MNLKALFQNVLRRFPDIGMPEHDLDSQTRINDLLAFRTIITMLSTLQRSAFTTGPIATIKEDRNELKVLDALSAILVRGNEIAAVVASKDQVIASVVHASNTDFLLQPDAACNSASGQGFWRRFSVAPNPRTQKIHGHFDSLINHTSFPLIRDDEIPVELTVAHASGKKRLLEVFLKTQW
jgi:hypothetical protein